MCESRYYNNIVMHVPITSIGWTVIDKPLGAGLILFTVNISLQMC